MQHSNRRDFLKTAAITGVTVGAGLAADTAFTRKLYAQTKGKNTLRFRELGKTGIKVTEVGFGVMNTRDPELIKAGLDAGINWFDTAHGYMKGVNEETLGKVLKETGRKDIFVATKVHAKGRDGKTVREMMETSLKRLQMNHVDIMFMHMPDEVPEITVEQHMKAFEQAKKDGLARFIGVSIHTNHVALADAITNSKFWEALLIGYNHRSEPEVTKAIERARKAGLAVIAMKTQDKGKGFANHNMGNINTQQAALKWVLQNKYVDTTIPGVTNFEQLEENVAVMGMQLSLLDSHEMHRFAKAPRDGYCRGVTGCTGCQGQCPFGVEICELNRCLGYAYGYGDLRLARENYAELPASSHVEVCGDCDVCQVKCVNGLDLTDSIRRAGELFA
jgi:aryl-alcohol dehydrogenase-like predicted oxidoreductase